MNKDRLLRLADLLDAHRDNGIRFDLGVWHSENRRDGNWCGTKACAVGLACVDPQFNAEGLKLENGWFPAFSGGEITFYEWEAARQFFDLEDDEELYLFWCGAYDDKPTGDSGAREVAERIRRMVNDGPPPKERLHAIHIDFRGLQ